MQSRKFGKGNLEVSANSLGRMGIGFSCGPPKDKQEMMKLLNAAVDRGVTSFDTAEVYGPYIHKELVGEAELSGKHLVDVYCLWQNCEPRTLESAHKRFVGGDLDGAHSAEADTRATAAVLKAMARAFKVEETWDALAKASATNWIGPSNHFQWQGGVAVVGFGKHRGKPLEVLAETEPGYLDFIIGREFPKHVVAICERMVELSADGRLTREGLTTWLVEEFGAAPSEE